MKHADSYQSEGETAEPVTPAGNFAGPWPRVAFMTGVACAAYYMWVAAVGIRHPEIDRSLFVLVGIVLAFALKPLAQSVPARLLDCLLIALAVAATVRFNVMYATFLNIIGLPISDLDMVLGWIMIAISIEACRRVLGLAIPALAVLFLAFLLFGPYMPAPFDHVGFDPRTIASYMYAGTDGIYGHITYVLASQMFLFLVFGAFLMRSGAADFFSEISMALVGSRAGGTGKAAVVSSTIVGSITGSAAANVAVTGAVTIPLMKKAGFKPHVAGGIEAAASTGGTVLPPVMGVAAFIMVALTGIPYGQIALYSATPALLYFFFVYAQVHLYSRRNGLVGAPRSELPRVWPTLKAGWFFVLPIVVIAGLVMINYSLALIALLAIAATLIASWMRRDTRMGLRSIVEAMAEGTRQALPIIVVAGPVAIIAQCLLLPGTGLRITGMIISAGAGNLPLTMLLVFIVAYILGMGLSVVPAYIILATLAAPALIQLDVPVLAAHLLVMWWGQASNITPPVALASYVASSIANSPLWQTGWAAVIKGAGLFFIPALFVYQPGLLYEGSAFSIALTIGSIILGIIAASGAIEGFLFRRLSVAQRVLLGVGAVLLTLGQDMIVVGLGLAISALAFVIPQQAQEVGSPN